MCSFLAPIPKYELWTDISLLAYLTTVFHFLSCFILRFWVSGYSDHVASDFNHCRLYTVCVGISMLVSVLRHWHQCIDADISISVICVQYRIKVPNVCGFNVLDIYWRWSLDNCSVVLFCLIFYILWLYICLNRILRGVYTLLEEATLPKWLFYLLTKGLL